MKINYFMKPLILFMALLTFAGSCKKHGGKVKIDEDFKLTITHIGCRGFCPAFSISVDAAGNATYIGTRNVDRIGEFHKNIGTDKVKELIAVLDEYKYTEFAAEYGGEVADLPSVMTEVVRDGKAWKTNNIRNAPAALDEMQKKLEEIIGADGFE
jgi:Domain of unknown function (DUF6438)